jgi:23S rRNA pseudouridine1911/1915/1917 synthase
VPPAAAGERLDRHVAAHLDRPRNQVRRWIEDGRVLVNGAAAKPSAALAAGDRIDCAPPPLADDRIEPEEAPLAVLHEDPHLIVLDKPAGLTVHPGAGRPTGTLAHRLLARYPEMAGVGGPGRPGIVHRLDKDTSGLLVVARTPEAYDRLSRAFATRAIEKLYLAVVYGAPSPPAGRIEAPIGRHPRRRKEMAVRPGGRPAATAYRTLAAAAGISLLELTLETGRTHQIRVHLKHRGHPLVGDPLYGEARWKSLPAAVRAPLERFPRPALHAWRLAFSHPITGAPLHFEAPVPEDLRALWRTATGQPLPV